MDGCVEFELKFQVPAHSRAAVEAAMRRGAVRQQRLQARYYDTADGALAAQGIVLRLRQEDHAWVQTAKGKGASAFARLEHEVPLAGSRKPTLDLARHAAHELGPRIRQALEDAGATEEALKLHYATDVTRLSRTVEASGSCVEIAFDEGNVHTLAHALPLCEIEFERKEGSATATVELAMRWAAEHGLWLDPVTKSMLGQRLALGAPPAPVHAEPVRGQPQNTADWITHTAMAALHQSLGNAREILAGEAHDEHVHQLRVGLRRLRTLLRELTGLAELERVDPAVPQTLATLFGVLGEHRDLSLLVPTLNAEIETAGGPHVVWSPALPDLAAVLRETQVQQAFLELIGWTLRVAEQAAADTTPLKQARRHVAARLDKLCRQVRKEGRRFESLPQDEQHRVRKRLKRLRYLSELARPLFKGAQVDRFVDELRELQDELGRFQDLAAGRALWTAQAVDQPSAWFGAGWLVAREEDVARRCERACRKWKRDARPFWA